MLRSDILSVLEQANGGDGGAVCCVVAEEKKKFRAKQQN